MMSRAVGIFLLGVDDRSCTGIAPYKESLNMYQKMMGLLFGVSVEQYCHCTSMSSNASKCLLGKSCVRLEEWAIRSVIILLCALFAPLLGWGHGHTEMPFTL